MPDPTLSSLDKKAECPRCGYDQRGVVAAWRDACPLEGTCSECGLEYEWRHLLDPKFIYPQWCVEYGIGIWACLRRSVMTLMMMFRPKKFWSELWIEHDQRPLRILWVNAALCIALRYILICAMLGIMIGMRTAGLRSSGLTTDSPVAVGIQTAAMPWNFRGNRQFRDAWYDLQAFEHFPISSKRISLVRRQPLAAQRSSTYGVNAARLMFWSCWIVLLTPIGMAALPVSRRVAKVRWRHLTRIWLYSFPILLLPMLFDAYIYLDYSNHEVAISRLTVIATLLMTFLWWRAAVKHYLRMPHAGVVSAGIMIVSFLVALAAFGALDLAADLLWIMRTGA